MNHQQFVQHGQIKFTPSIPKLLNDRPDHSFENENMPTLATTQTPAQEGINSNQRGTIDVDNLIQQTNSGINNNNDGTTIYTYQNQTESIYIRHKKPISNKIYDILNKPEASDTRDVHLITVLHLPNKTNYQNILSKKIHSSLHPNHQTSQFTYQQTHQAPQSPTKTTPHIVQQAHQPPITLRGWEKQEKTTIGCLPCASKQKQTLKKKKVPKVKNVENEIMKIKKQKKEIPESNKASLGFVEQNSNQKRTENKLKRIIMMKYCNYNNNFHI